MDDAGAESGSKREKKPRGKGKPFAPGNCANPGGRPKKLEELAVKCREFESDHVARLNQIARDGDDKDSVAAIKLLWSYGRGNPVQAITGEDGQPIKFDLD